MTTTVNGPHGHRVRTASRRRFIVVSANIAQAWIERRSDSVEVARNEARKIRQRRGASETKTVVIDTVTGEQV